MRVLVLADTHLRRAWPNRVVPDAVWRAAERADVILHAGDVVEQQHLDELATYAPVHAVLGNNDIELVGTLPEELTCALAGVTVAMVHDSGATKGREARLHGQFPNADLVVFGHSHIPWNAEGAEGQWLFNPGSPTERRRQPFRSYGELDLADGRIVASRIVLMDDAGAPMEQT